MVGFGYIFIHCTENKNPNRYASCHKDILREAVSWSRTDSLGCPSFPFVLVFWGRNDASDVSKVDVDLLLCRLRPLFGTLVDYDFVDEGSQDLRG